MVSPREPRPHVLFALPPNLARNGAVRVPAGVLVLGSILERAGFTTDYWLAAPDGAGDANAHVFTATGPAAGQTPTRVLAEYTAELLARLERAERDGAVPVLGLSCFTSALFLSSMLVAAVVRHRRPHTPIVVGGWHATIDPESLTKWIGTEVPAARALEPWALASDGFFTSALLATVAIRSRADFVFDRVFVGRAETVLAEELDGLARRGRDVAPRVVSSPGFDAGQLGEFRYSLDVLGRLAVGAPGGHFDLCFSFGCPYTCAFCVNSTRPERWQVMEVGHAVDVLERLHLDHGVTRFSILDANFGVDPRWRTEFFVRLWDRPWAARVRLDVEASVGTFELPPRPTGSDALGGMALTVQVGVESGSATMLERMQKTRSPERYLARLAELIEELVGRADLIGLLLIFGYPGETAATLRETCAFLFERCRVLERPNVIVLPQLYSPLAGTTAAELAPRYAEEHGFASGDPRWWRTEVAPSYAALRPSRGLSEAVCAELVQRFVDYFLGDGRAGSGRVGAGGEPPPIVLKGRLERRAFRDGVYALLESE